MKNPANAIYDKSGKKKVSGTTTKATEKDVEAFNYNYAKRQDVCDRFMEQFASLIGNTRNNRKTLEESWLEDLQQWSCRSDEQGYVPGFSNIFVPELNNQVETGVEKALATNFPGPDWIWAVPMKGTTPEKAEKIRRAVVNELENKNNIFVKSDEFERQKYLFGTSVWKASFRKEMIDIFTRDPNGKPQKTQVPRYYGVQWDVVDLFKWYIYPETSDLDTCMFCFEDSMQNIKDLKGTGLYENMDQVTSTDWDTNHMWVDVQRLQFDYLSNAMASRPGCAVFTEVWCDFEIKKGLKVPVMAVIANQKTVVRLTRNPYWNQKSPYLADRLVKRPGKLFYGFSVADKIRTTTHTMTDVAGQTFDSLTYSLNPIAIIDPALAGDVNSMKLMPGAKWLGSPEGIQFTSFPDVTPSGLRAMGELRGMIAQFSDNSPGIAPQLQGKARSATQATLVSAAVTQKQRVQSKSEEATIYGPMGNTTHMMMLQFMDDEWPIRMQGPDGGAWISEVMQPTDLIGAVDFVWKGSSQLEKTAVRSQQLLAFYNSALQTMTVLPPGELDIQALFMKVAKEAFGLEDIDELFKSLRDKQTIDPDVENVALYDVQDLPVHIGDNDKKHITVHQEVIDDPKSTEQQKLMAQRHIERHELQEKAKAQIEQAQAKMRAIQMQQMNEGSEGQSGPQGSSGGMQAPGVPGINEGNRGQSMSSPDAVMSSVKGVDSQV